MRGTEALHIETCSGEQGNLLCYIHMPPLSHVHGKGGLHQITPLKQICHHKMLPYLRSDGLLNTMAQTMLCQLVNSYKARIQQASTVYIRRAWPMPPLTAQRTCHYNILPLKVSSHLPHQFLNNGDLTAGSSINPQNKWAAVPA